MTDQLDDDIPLYLQLLWRGEDASRPGPRRGADLRSIGAAGLRIADQDGLGAVSMRRVAGDLGFTTMALYRYVRSKDELLALVVDAAFPATPEVLPQAAGSPVHGWRPALTAWATALRDVLSAHPWVLQVPIGEPPLTPNQVAWMEAGLGALARTPLAEQEKLSSILLLDVYVRGQTQLSLGMSAARNPAAADTGPPDDLYARRLRALADPAVFPRITAALASGALEDDTDVGVDEFGFGLGTVLDGIAARIALHR